MKWTKQDSMTELQSLLTILEEGRVTIDTSPALIARVNELKAALDRLSDAA